MSRSGARSPRIGPATRRVVPSAAAIATVLAVVSLGLMTHPAGADEISCDDMRWTAVWAGPPSDASRTEDVSSIVDPSANRLGGVRNSTVRAIATPSTGGSETRVHLSNRFGTAPVTFDRVTIGVQTTGPAVAAGSLEEVRFDGEKAVTVAAGDDAVSDSVAFSFESGQPIAVSVFVAGDAAMPTIHYTARQASYLTPPNGGDQTTDVEGSKLSEKTTSRPYLTGIDVRTTGDFGTVVALGDSITDGFQGQAPDGRPETVEGIDQNVRYPDFLAERLRSAGKPLGVINAGISGNRLLRDGADGGNIATNGPSTASRVEQDVLGRAGVTTVILLVGINDLGKTPNATADELISGYVEMIQSLHQAGLNVVHGTLTPVGGSTSYGTPEIEAERQKVNAWIRSNSPADAIVDFDAALRDPVDATRLDPRFDGGDHLHMSPAGNRAMAEAVDPGDLRPAACAATGATGRTGAEEGTGTGKAPWIAALVAVLLIAVLGAAFIVHRHVARERTGP